MCWLHDKQEIDASDASVYQVLVNGNIHKLLIPDVLPEDAGTWACEAYNHYGDALTSCVLTVKGKLKRTIKRAENLKTKEFTPFLYVER